MTQIKAIISNIANKKRTILTIQETKLLGREELAIERNSKIPAGASARLARVWGIINRPMSGTNKTNKMLGN